MAEEVIAGRGLIVPDHHVVERDVAAVVQDAPALRRRFAGHRAGRAVVLGVAALDDDVLECDRARRTAAEIEDLEDRIGGRLVDDARGLAVGIRGALDDERMQVLVMFKSPCVLETS